MSLGNRIIRATTFVLGSILAGWAFVIILGADMVTHERPIGGSKPTSKRWSDILGEEVAVEGIAWGSVEKGRGPYLIINGGIIHVTKADFLTKKYEGRLVRVIGTMRSMQMNEPSKPPVKGQLETLYYIEAKDVIEIDRVEWPWVCRTHVQ